MLSRTVFCFGNPGDFCFVFCFDAASASERGQLADHSRQNRKQNKNRQDCQNRKQYELVMIPYLQLTLSISCKN